MKEKKKFFFSCFWGYSWHNGWPSVFPAAVLVGSCWREEAGGRAPHVIVLEAYLAFSVGPELDMRAKTREAGLKQCNYTMQQFCRLKV